MRKSAIVVSLVIVVCCILVIAVKGGWTQSNSKVAKAEETSAAHIAKVTGGQFVASADVGGRINPPGLAVTGGISYRHILGHDEKYKAAISYLQTGAGLSVSPSMLQAGIHLEVQPWIFLPLRFQYDYYEYFGTSGGLLSFAGPRTPYGDDVRKDRHDEERAHGHRLLFQPTLQGKINRFVFRNTMGLAYYRFSGRGPYFLELSCDTLLKDGDWLISNRTFSLYSVFDGDKKQTLLTGPYYEVTRAFDAQITQQKIGWSAYWEPVSQYLRFQNPYVGVMAGYHLQDPNRQGQFFLMIATGVKISL